jgi:hypothetical protein
MTQTQTQILMIECLSCRRWWFALRPNRFTCEIFPHGIPRTILDGGTCDLKAELKSGETRTGRPE